MQKKRPVGVIIASVFLTIIMITLGFYAILGISVRSAFQEKTIQKTVQRIEITTIKVEGKELSGFVTDKINETVTADNFKVTEEEVKEVLENEEVKKFITENLSEYADAIFNGKTDVGLTKDKIKEFLQSDVCADIAKDHNISAEDFNGMTDEIVAEIPDEYMNVETLISEVVSEQTNFLPLIRNVFSYTSMYIAAGIALVIFVGMLFMNRLRPGFSGVGGIIIGLWGCAIGALSLLGGAILNKFLPMGTDFFDCILSGFMIPAFSMGGSVFIVSLVVLVVLSVVNKKRRTASEIAVMG